FSDRRLSLAVARGSGAAAAQLGSIARQAGIPVSLHGTGGAWLVADTTADTRKFASAVYHSLDRKVCNTLNVCCIPRDRAAEMGREWEWEETPEVTLKIVADLDEAIALFNRWSPQFIACLVSEDPAAHRRFHDAVNAPFVGSGFTRWVDGQYALNRPELGLA